MIGWLDLCSGFRTENIRESIIDIKLVNEELEDLLVVNRTDLSEQRFIVVKDIIVKLIPNTFIMYHFVVVQALHS